MDIPIWLIYIHIHIGYIQLAPGFDLIMINLYQWMIRLGLSIWLRHPRESWLDLQRRHGCCEGLLIRQHMRHTWRSVRPLRCRRCAKSWVNSWGFGARTI